MFASRKNTLAYFLKRINDEEKKFYKIGTSLAPMVNFSAAELESVL